MRVEESSVRGEQSVQCELCRVAGAVTQKRVTFPVPVRVVLRCIQCSAGQLQPISLFAFKLQPRFWVSSWVISLYVVALELYQASPHPLARLAFVSTAMWPLT